MKEGIDILDGACVYIIDDERGLVWALSESLKVHGCRTVVAYSGAEALRTMRSIPPDAVILDIMMPDMDGFRVCQEMRKNPLLARVPVIFLTALNDIEAKVEAYGSGGDDFLTKPYRLLEVKFRLAALLRRFPPRGDRDELQVGELALDRQRCQVRVGRRRVSLTPLECDLLECLLRKAGEIISVDNLLKLWAFHDGHDDPSLVRGAIRQLRAKIERDPANPEYVRTVRGFGYMVATPECIQ